MCILMNVRQNLKWNDHYDSVHSVLENEYFMNEIIVTKEYYISSTADKHD